MVKMVWILKAVCVCPVPINPFKNMPPTPKTIRMIKTVNRYGLESKINDISSLPNNGYKKNSGNNMIGNEINSVVNRLSLVVLMINGKTACRFLLPMKLLTKVLIPAEYPQHGIDNIR